MGSYGLNGLPFHKYGLQFIKKKTFKSCYFLLHEITEKHEISLRVLL